jgi:hypothetical protein
MKRALLAATLLLPIEAQADPTKEWISVITAYSHHNASFIPQGPGKTIRDTWKSRKACLDKLRHPSREDDGSTPITGDVVDDGAGTAPWIEGHCEVQYIMPTPSFYWRSVNGSNTVYEATDKHHRGDHYVTIDQRGLSSKRLGSCVFVHIRPDRKGEYTARMKCLDGGKWSLTGPYSRRTATFQFKGNKVTITDARKSKP